MLRIYCRDRILHFSTKSISIVSSPRVINAVSLSHLSVILGWLHAKLRQVITCA